MIKIRVTESEYDQLIERSQKPRLAEWMREFCLGQKYRKLMLYQKFDPSLYDN
ncbi:hypothetical protein ACP5PY_18030 [Photobacterium leiognathi subsp. mandapamensis]